MNRLFVGNMSFKATESDLHKVLKPFVQVKRARVAVAADSWAAIIANGTPAGKTPPLAT